MKRFTNEDDAWSFLATEAAWPTWDEWRSQKHVDTSNLDAYDPHGQLRWIGFCDRITALHLDCTISNRLTRVMRRRVSRLLSLKPGHGPYLTRSMRHRRTMAAFLAIADVRRTLMEEP